jgi:O-antigen/teichoic acid export membrane protein
VVEERQKSVRRALPAGLIDSGLTSLGTFAISLFAARALEPVALGAYALFFPATMTLGIVPTQLILLPAEVSALGLRGSDRLRLFQQSFRLVAPFSLSALAVVLVALVVPREVPSALVLPLALTAFPASLFSPLQDHVRRTLHLAGHSWAAAAVSAIQLAAALTLLIGLSLLGVPPVWIPFGSLAAANALSTLTGVIIARRWAGGRYPESLQRRELAGSGRWLLVGSLVPSVSGFTASALIAHLAGAAALGYAEAARVVARPLEVFAFGLGFVLNPRSMEAAREQNEAAARRISRSYTALVLGLAVLYGGVVALPWAGNVFARLLPTAYVVGGLVAVTILSAAVSGLTVPFRAELVGGRKEVALARISMLSAAVQVLVGGAAGVLGAFAKPLSLVASTGLAWLRFGRALSAHYRAGVLTPDQPGSETSQETLHHPFGEQ